MSKLIFKPEDFLIEWETPDGIRFEAQSKTGERIAKSIAQKANARLAEMLKDAPVVIAREQEVCSLPPVWVLDELFVGARTHRALLVNIEEIKEKK